MKKKIGQFIDSRLENLQAYLQEKKFFISHLEIRSIRHFFQRIFFGFSDKETWSLNTHTSKYLLPRIKRLREINNVAYPHYLPSLEKWHEVLDKICFALMWDIYVAEIEEEKYKKELLKSNLNEDDWYRLAKEGFSLLGTYYTSLGW